MRHGLSPGQIDCEWAILERDGYSICVGLGVSMSARVPLMNLIEGQPWVFEADLDIRGGIDHAAY